MIVKTVVLLACHSLVSCAAETQDVIRKSLGSTFSGSSRVRNDIVMYRPSSEEELDDDDDLLTRRNNVKCTRPGLQCASDYMTLLECSATLEAISAWDCQRIFPKHLFLGANAVEVLCDPFRASCAALIQVTELEDNRPELEPNVGHVTAESQPMSDFPANNFYSAEKAEEISSKDKPKIRDNVSLVAADNRTTENGTTDNKAKGFLNENDSAIENNNFANSPLRIVNNTTVQSNDSTPSDTNAAEDTSLDAEPVATLPYVKCRNQGLHCADAATIVDCDNESSEPLFELSCSSMLQSTEMERDYGKCDDTTASCLLSLGGFPLRMRVFLADDKLGGACVDGTLTCADNSTLVACSGDSSIPSYAINCAGEESNDAFYSFCDSEQKGCMIKRKDSIGTHNNTNNKTISQNLTTTTSTSKNTPSIVAIPSMFLIPPLIPLSESVRTTTEAYTTLADDKRLCREVGWKCANSSTLVLCSSQAEPLVQLDCNITDHPYCNVMTGHCTLEENTVPQSPCLHPGLQCITDHVLGWCSNSLQVRHATACEVACNADTHNCQEPPSTATSTTPTSTSMTQEPSSSSVIPSVIPLQSVNPVQPSANIIPATVTPGAQPLLGPCSKPGMQCIGTDMLGSCDMDLTLSYVVPCSKLLPYADTNSVEVFCDREIDACAISQVLDSYTD